MLNKRPAPDSWTALECLEHINRYGDFYLPAIEKSILAQPTNTSLPIFKPGWLGNFFATIIQVKNGKIKKMKAPKAQNPLRIMLNITTIDRFLKQAAQLHQLLEKARQVNITRATTPITLSRLVKIRLGDTFRFVTYHIERHVQQAQRAVGGNPL